MSFRSSRDCGSPASKSLRFACIAAAVSLVLFGGTSEVADAATAPDQLLNTVTAAEPAPITDESLKISQNVSTGELSAATTTATVGLPSANTAWLTLSTGTTSFQVQPLAAIPATASLSSGLTAATYSGSDETVSTVIQPYDGAAEISQILSDESAPESVQYQVKIPDGASLQLLDDGSVGLYGDDGRAIGYIGRPWARDAVESDVQTYFTVSGDIVTQHILHHGRGLSYPIVSDPFLFKDLISSAHWVYEDHGYTLQVSPTPWARHTAIVFAGSLTGAHIARDGWNELYAKYRNYGLCCNLEGMREQYWCHFQLVALRAPNKPTWNLDEWRINETYLATLWDRCNPPMGGPYYHA